MNAYSTEWYHCSACSDEIEVTLDQIAMLLKDGECSCGGETLKLDLEADHDDEEDEDED